mmetsp:Transcript_51804/g.82637  ORF Transcript_51804/g.82637 Transcript_51804/m.82637 type:complete len:252 (-) Transcript_51804:54-809(-)|eukprot:CAMPEP_0197030202 /NCGR_PEP_ID=MMETSP1384-20130603/9482_1 /TAXON_ID=29189 /ORGANISM="Ammonia sp." /LENGTH=251 /DNA_ID=CAMNT_0042459497 /DNA_START=43 /DNA_END=798 /DNA_ORIENTATION=+
MSYHQQQQQPPPPRAQQRSNARQTSSLFPMDCAPCTACSASCPTSMIFLSFVAFYIFSFLWDIFILLGGWSALPISQSPACVARSGYDNISPALVLVLLFIAVFHATALVWIIGFVHWKSVSSHCLTSEYWSNGHCVDVPTEYCHPSLYIPFCCFDLLMIVQFGLSLYVFLFLNDLVENQPESYVDRFCGGYDDTEEAMLWMQISIYFFIGTCFMGCVYGVFIMIATNDRSILQEGRQPVFSPQSSPIQSP